MGPDMLRFRQSLVQKIQELACRVQVLGGDPIDKCGVRATAIRAHDDVVLGARGQAILLHHNGNQRSRHDATGNQGKGSERFCSVKAELPTCTIAVACHQGGRGRCPKNDALTADLSKALGCSTVHGG